MIEKTAFGEAESFTLTGDGDLQFYSGNYLNLPIGKGGPMGMYQGFCMETQNYPDAPNHPEFPSAVLRAGETFTSVTEYRFFE